MCFGPGFEDRRMPLLNGPKVLTFVLLLMRMNRSKLPMLMVTLALVLFGTGDYVRWTEAQTSLPKLNSHQFINGQWFDGRSFRRRIFYSVNGRFTQKKPAKIDDVVDLKNGYVIPPFSDAHTHHFDNPANIAHHVAMYLKDGVFYAKVPTDVRTRALEVVDRVNQPTSVDVSYSHGGLTSSYGHPMATYEGLALFRHTAPFNAEETLKVRASHLRDDDAYYIIDTTADLESKWSKILAGKPDFIKVYLLYGDEYKERRKRTDAVGHTGLDPKLVPLIVKKAHAAGLRVTAHVTSAFDFRAALRAGVDEMAHLPGYYIALKDDPRKYQLTEADAKETARRGVWVVPAPAFSETFSPQSPSFNAQIKERTDAVRIHNLKLLQRYRVKIAFGSDNFGQSPVKDVFYLKTLGVFSNLEMLKIWCEETPRTIFPNRKIGLLAEGYESSFLVLDGNPLLDFEQVKSIRMAYKQGYFLAQE